MLLLFFYVLATTVRTLNDCWGRFWEKTISLEQKKSHNKNNNNVFIVTSCYFNSASILSILWFLSWWLYSVLLFNLLSNLFEPSRPSFFTRFLTFYILFFFLYFFPVIFLFCYFFFRKALNVFHCLLPFYMSTFFL